MTISSIQKMEILLKYKDGNSMRKIAEQMHLNLKTVNKWIKRYSDEKSLVRKKGTGLYKRKEISL